MKLMKIISNLKQISTKFPRETQNQENINILIKLKTRDNKKVYQLVNKIDNLNKKYLETNS